MFVFLRYIGFLYFTRVYLWFEFLKMHFCKWEDKLLAWAKNKKSRVFIATTNITSVFVCWEIYIFYQLLGSCRSFFLIYIVWHIYVSVTANVRDSNQINEKFGITGAKYTSIRWKYRICECTGINWFWTMPFPILLTWCCPENKYKFCIQ